MTCRIGLLIALSVVSLAAVAEPPPLRNDWGQEIAWGAAIKNVQVHAALCDEADSIWGIVSSRAGGMRVVARWTEAGWTPAKLRYSIEAAKFVQKSSYGSTNDSDANELSWMEYLYSAPDGTVFATSRNIDAPGVQLRGGRGRWMTPPAARGNQGSLLEDRDGAWWLVWGAVDQFFVEGPREKTPVLTVNFEERGLDRLLATAKQRGLLAARFVKDSDGRFWYTHTDILGGYGQSDLTDAFILDPNFSPENTKLDVLGAGFPRTFITNGVRTELLGSPEDRMENKTISFILPKNEKTFWLGESEHTLKEIDTHALCAKEVRIAPAQQMPGISCIAQSKGVWYATDKNSLWQEKAGVWTPILKDIDGEKQIAPDKGLHRPLLATDLGLWVGLYSGSGALFLSKDAKTEHVDWHKGFPVSRVDVLLQLPRKKLMFASYNASPFITDENALLQTKPSPTTREPVFVSRVMQDAQGYIWKVDSTPGSPAVSRWESGAWRTFRPAKPNDVASTPPGKPVPTQMELLAALPLHFNTVCDTLGRIWFIEIGYEGHTSTKVFTPPAMGSEHEGAWVDYPSYRDALVGERERKPAFLAQRSNYPQPKFDVSFGPKGQIAYLEERLVYWYDGAEWRHWSRAKEFKEENRNFNESVCFDSKGRLQYNGKLRYILDASGKWNAVQISDDAIQCSCPRDAPRDDKAKAPDYAMPNPDVCVRDRSGAYWLQYGTRIFHAAYGVSLPVLADNELTPLGHGRWIAYVLTDPAGSSYVGYSTDGAQSETSYLVFPDPNKIPVAHVHGRVENTNTVVLDTSAEPEGVYLYTWRMDGKDWSNATKDLPIRIAHAPSGKHTFEVRAIGEHSEVSVSPASVSLEVTVQTNVVAEWIAELSSDDFDKRRDAVKSLAASGPEAITQLREAREKANADTQWWIDSAIQRCEEALKRPAPSPKAE